MNKQSETQAKYDANNTRRYSLKLNLKTDKDIIKHLDGVGSIQGYIRDLIRKDLQRITGSPE